MRRYLLLFTVVLIPVSALSQTLPVSYDSTRPREGIARLRISATTRPILPEHRAVLDRTMRILPVSDGALEPVSNLPDINEDPRYRANLVKMLTEPAAGPKPRVFGGVASYIGDVVAVRGQGRICSGVLISKDVVLTAGHCECAGVSKTVYFGSDITKDPGTIFQVTKSTRKSNCAASAQNEFVEPGNDFALLWLSGSSAVSPALIAPNTVTSLYTVLVAGFGYTDKGDLGKKMQADVPVASADCSGHVGDKPDSKYYGCVTGKELIAARLQKNDPQKDTCEGDSGGPIYSTSSTGALNLVGITSRGIRTPTTAKCGDGGTYEIINTEFLDWASSQGVLFSVAK